MNTNKLIEGRLLRITGRVQGVGYRWSMAQQAQKLGLRGWVRNRHDGSVEALIAGSAEALAAMLTWTQQGPPAAQVLHLQTEFVATQDLPNTTLFEQLPSL